MGPLIGKGEEREREIGRGGEVTGPIISMELREHTSVRTVWVGEKVWMKC